MEVISRDWWERHRTEGYAHLPLRLKPGQYTEDLGCVRPEEKDKVFADSRRYFIGGCNLLDDLEFLAKPQGTELASDFRLVATGKIRVRWSVIRQVQATERGTTDRSQTTSSSALLSGADAALRRYRRARATLAAAAKGLDLPLESGIGTPGDGSEELDSTDDDS
ncbi:Meckel syndrome type 1 protein homolog [Eumeta japonica]|uniref:Meckel syndrome type 1 protein homolog n=1 Tax=Eumeta variegata TaxID=151549 RepID=A0A4C1VJD3_EUMVA|nr:Meckel syndrome type 1 protein homolog [Eumeta japonica]